MTTIATLVRRHPVVAYYILTFAISWGGILLVVGGPAGIPGTQAQIDRLMPLAILFMLFGPCLASLVCTGLVDGRAGYAALLARLCTWRVNPVWYAVALLTAPVVYLPFRAPTCRASSQLMTTGCRSSSSGPRPDSWSGYSKRWAGPGLRSRACGSTMACSRP